MSASPSVAVSSPPRWLLLLVLGIATAAFLPTLTGGFLADDFVYIARFRELPWSEWPRLFTQEWSGGVWGQPLRELRPIAALSLMGDARMFGGDPLGYRLSNLAVHLFAVLLVARLAWHYSEGSLAATGIAGGIFALHPAHVEAVAWITGRVDLLGATAALLYWLAAELFCTRGHGARLAIAGVALFLGIFAKEFCAFAPLLLLLRWVLLDPRAPREQWRRRWVLLAVSVAIVIVYAVCRRAALGHDSIGYNVWTDVPAWHRQMSYAGWLVSLLPFTGHAEWQSFPSITLLHGVWIALAVAIVFGLALARWRHARVAALALFFGGIWYLFTVTPLAGVVYHSPRHLYFPTVGLALAIGLACSATRLRIAVGMVLVGWCAAGHVAALQPWLRAGQASRSALQALDRELTQAGPGAVAVTAAPATMGPAWMWAWSSPQAFERPFLASPPARIIEHPVSYSRSGPWLETRLPLETVRAAPALVALLIEADGRIFCRRVTAAELPACAEALAQTIARGGLSGEAWTEWVKNIAVR